MLRKILLLSLGILILATLLIGYTLYSPVTYPQYETEGLQTTTSAELPEGAMAEVPPHTFADSVPPKNLDISNGLFIRSDGAAVMLRGINLGGSSKLPYSPKLPTHRQEGFFDIENLSFVGRPFPLNEADEHFGRLKHWGFNFVRLLITWEAVEHEAPGVYDSAYLDYLYQLCQKAEAHGINLFIDPHQDVWGRFSGGDGAPAWTYEKVGLDITKFKETGAALVHNTYEGEYPKMVWPSNYGRTAAATMFTLFFAGDDFAPRTFVEDVPVQEYLQSHYINAMKAVAEKLKGLPNVVGFDTFNEPSVGYIGQSNLDTVSSIRAGATPTLLQGMALAAGIPQTVTVYQNGINGAATGEAEQLNPEGVSAWLPGHQPIWQEHGVWRQNDAGEVELMMPDYFTQVDGKQVDFPEDYFKPFLLRYRDSIRAAHPEYIIFAEPALFTEMPQLNEAESHKIVHAGHWYDFITLITKSYNPVLSFDIGTAKPLVGKKNIAEAFIRQLSELKGEGLLRLNGNPVLVGEFGIPFDMGEKAAFETGDFSDQTATLERSMMALEANLLHYTLWNYTADNDNLHGDQWNGEDLSIFSRDQQNGEGPYRGGRALEAAIRPFPKAVQGVPTQSRFNSATGEYLLEFTHDAKVATPTQIFLPNLHFANGFEILHTPGSFEWDKTNQTLVFRAEGNTEKHRVVVRKVQKD